MVTDGEALDIAQNSPVSNGMKVWRRMVTRWEPKVPSRFRVPKWDVAGSDVTQLLTALDKQVQDYERCNQDVSCAPPFARCLFA